MEIKYFEELFYIRCPNCGHERNVAEIPQAKAKLNQGLLPNEELCLQVRNLLARLDLFCEKCGEREPEIDCRDAHKELKVLLRKKAWLKKRELEILEDFCKQIESGKGLTWNQIETFENIRQAVSWRERPKIVRGGGGGGKK